ncbi:UDP-glucose 4-epimerase [subsurface metagenome]
MIDSIILEDLRKIRGFLKKGDFEGKRVLVTGGAGFVGSWICDVLVSSDAEVHCLDNFATGKTENVDHLLGKVGFKLVDEDVCNFKTEVKYDYVLHLASRASPEEYQQHPIKTLQANSLGSYNVLELARKSDAGILFASTSEVYGDAEVVPTPETYWGNVNPVGPRSCYDEGKRFGEALFMAYHWEYGLDVRIARIFNTFGPRLRAEGAYGRAVSRFIIQALSNQPMTVYGDGSQSRSFCYVADTVLGLLLFCADEGASGEVLNIGNPKEITILELAHKIKQMTGSASPVTFHPLPEDDPRRRCPDIGKAERLLGWKPEVSLEQGLHRTITWFQRNERLV